MEEETIGFEEGATCGIDGCDGILVFEPDDCSCHISPPCGSCLDGLVCTTCWARGRGPYD